MLFGDLVIMQFDRIFLHQDNVPEHRAESTQLEISLLGFEVGLLDHPPYSSDLAPMDFRGFPELKEGMCGKRFDLARELTKQTHIVVSSLTEDWYFETYNKWMTRHKKCIDMAGDYVEEVRRSLDGNGA